jgi:hypothetical protein
MQELNPTYWILETGYFGFVDLATCPPLVIWLLDHRLAAMRGKGISLEAPTTDSTRGKSIGSSPRCAHAYSVGSQLKPFTKNTIESVKSLHLLWEVKTVPSGDDSLVEVICPELPENLNLQW